jgi:hypothetical protein
MFNNYEDIALRRLDLHGNSANRGGGLFARGTDLAVTNTAIWDNQANKGGALFMTHGLVTEKCPDTTTPDPNDLGPCPEYVVGLDFVVASANAAGEGAAIWVDVDGLVVEDSIVAANTGDDVQVLVPLMIPAVGVTFAYTDVSPATFEGIADPTGSGGNLAVDPGFTAAATGDFSLAVGSACLDAGDPAVLDGDGSRADMGRFGGPGAVTP